MKVIDKLLRLHTVDQQIRSLRQRIDGAERYLKQQDLLLEKLKEKQGSLAAQARQLEATLHNDETEMASIDEKVDKHRDQLNEAQTNKEYSALLTEVNTLKANRSGIEERTLEGMTRVEEIRSTITDIESQQEERKKIRKAAKADLKKRQEEIAESLDELETERKEAVSDAPAAAVQLFEDIVHRREDEAMAPIEEHSRRHMEYACGACQVLQPMEIVSAILGRGEIKQCSNCGAILYIDEELRDSMLSKPTKSTRSTKSTKSAKSAKSTTKSTKSTESVSKN